MRERRRVWQCKSCGGQTSVTAGTVVRNTQTPLQLWFWAVYLVATHHPGISAVQLPRQFGISRHERAWMMLHKLWRAMVAPEREPLKCEIEVDEFFIGGYQYQQGLKGGRARGKKVMCAVAVEVRGRGSSAPGRDPGCLRRLAWVVRLSDDYPWRDRSHRRLAGLQPTDRARGRSLAAQSELLARGGAIPPRSASRDLEPQGVATRHASPRITRPSAGVSRRVRLPAQPTRQPARSVSDTARPPNQARARQLPQIIDQAA